MTESIFNQRHGVLAPDKSLRIQRRLPGPMERVWAYLTDSELRSQWLASGDMQLLSGASFELVWRNDELSHSADERPDGFSAESRATCQFIEVEPPRRMRYIWPGVGEVSMELESVGGDVLLTVTHRQLVSERLILNVSAGWHAHLALLVARLEGTAPPSLWATWKQARAEYEEMTCDS
jgi:uncharacterized protein YndB with AHSA1/START domain